MKFKYLFSIFIFSTSFINCSDKTSSDSSNVLSYAARIASTWVRKASDNVYGHYINIIYDIDSGLLDSHLETSTIHRIEWAIEQGITKEENYEGVEKIFNFCCLKSVPINSMHKSMLTQYLLKILNIKKAKRANEIQAACDDLGRCEKLLSQAMMYNDNSVLNLELQDVDSVIAKLEADQLLRK